LQLDCVPGDSVLLRVQWTILEGGGRRVVAARSATFSESLGDERYETIVAAFSHLLEKLSREVAGEIPSRNK
jgi:uncharacterized lipoprotein YmbA